MSKYETLVHFIENELELALEMSKQSREANSEQHEFDRGVLFAYTKLTCKINDLEKHSVTFEQLSGKS